LLARKNIVTMLTRDDSPVLFHTLTTDCLMRAKPCLQILGQTFDGDGRPLHGEVDDYRRRSAVMRTSAQGRGAIEGSVADYRVATPFATNFRFSRFDSIAARPRDASRLRHANLLHKNRFIVTEPTLDNTTLVVWRGVAVGQDAKPPRASTKAE
jgi:hypothetical protein